MVSSYPNLKIVVSSNEVVQGEVERWGNIWLVIYSDHKLILKTLLCIKIVCVVSQNNYHTNIKYYQKQSIITNDDDKV